MRISDWSSDVCSSDLRGQPDRVDDAGLIDVCGQLIQRHPALQVGARWAFPFDGYRCALERRLGEGEYRIGPGRCRLAINGEQTIASGAAGCCGTTYGKTGRASCTERGGP